MSENTPNAYWFPIFYRVMPASLSQQSFTRFPVCSLLAVLLMLCSPAWAQTDPEASPVAGYLVGTVLGEPEGMGLSDFQTEADVLELSDFAFLPGGDLLVADAVQNRIFRVGLDGILRPLAGTGSAVSSGDQGSADLAGIPRPSLLATDALGAIYVAERFPDYSRIRRIGADGVIETIAGNGEAGCPVVGAAAAVSAMNRVSAMTVDSAGTVYFFATGCKRVFRIGRDGVIGLAGVVQGVAPPSEPAGSVIAFPAATVQFSNVTALAVDQAGNVMVGLSAPGALARITPDGIYLLLSAAPGVGERQGLISRVNFARSLSLAAIPGGGLAIAQEDSTVNGRAEFGVAAANEVYTTLVAEDGVGGKPKPLFQRRRVNPNLVRVSPDGTMYVRDAFSQSIFEVTPSGELIHRFRHFRPATPVITEGANPTFHTLQITNLVADSEGNVYFGDPVLQRIYVMTPGGAVTRIAGNGSAVLSGDGGPAADAGLGLGTRIAIDNQRRIYFAASGSVRLRRFSAGGTIETVLGGGVANEIVEGMSGLQARLNQLTSWTVSPGGEVYIYQRGDSLSSDLIWRLDLDGKLKRFLGADFGSPTAGFDGVPALEAYFKWQPASMEVDPTGTLYLQSGLAGGVYRVDEQGVVRAVVQETGNTAAVVEGGPTATAPRPFGGIMVAPAPGKLIVSAGFPQVLAEYTVGGTVRVLRRSDAGKPRQDGALLGNDQLLFNRSLAALADGSLVWSEWANNLVSIRRGMPVPNGCSYDVNASQLPVGGSNTLNQVMISTGPECPWTVGSAARWLHILSPRFGKGSTTVQFTAFANPSPAPRSASLRLAGREVTVNQAPSTRTDIFLVSPSAVSIPVTGATVPVSIVASPQQSWQVSLPSEPVTLTGPAAGSGPEVLFVAVPALPAGVVSRTLLLGVNDRTVRLMQAGPPPPVAVMIRANIPGATATIDLVQRALPYQTQWAPGSTHHLRVAPVLEVNADTRIRFEGWADSTEGAERIYFAPVTPSGLELSFRRFHRLSTVTSLGSSPNAPPLVTSYSGAVMPAEFPDSPAADGTQYRWFLEGATVSVLATNGLGQRFTSFSGATNTTQNPVTLSLDAPRQLSANYGFDATLPNSLVVSGGANWRFPGAGRIASAAQVTVAPGVNGSSTPPLPFIAYLAEDQPGDWLGLRQNNNAVPLTVEFALDPTAAMGMKEGRAVVYFHQPDAPTALVSARFSELEPDAGEAPHITAVTDAGGFRQAVSDNPATVPLVAAPGMILTMFGRNLAVSTASAATIPLPTNLAGTAVEYFSDIERKWIAVPLFFVSPGQINFQLPPVLNASAASGVELPLRVVSGVTPSSSEGRVMLRSRSISLFTANSSGSGAPAGFAVRVRASGEQERSNLFLCGNGQCNPEAAPLGGEGDEMFLELFGTGFRNPGNADEVVAFIGGRAATVAFAGPHPQFMGLDQINVKVPRDTPRGQPLDCYVWVRNGDSPWIASNRLTVRFE